ncbi:MAG: hypothetical protein SH868_02690 [Bythopirellula sp.]|nr:hypothetical protein [Bythopirellula sp.]
MQITPLYNVTRRICLLALLLAATSNHCFAASLYSVTRNPGRVNELDADTGVLLNSFPTPVVAQSGGGSGLAFSGTELFFSDISFPNIYRLNPHTGAVLGTFLRPAGSVDALAYGASSFGSTLFSLDYTANRFHLLNPLTGATFGSYAVGFDVVGGIDYNSFTGTLFASDTGGIIRQLNPDTGAILASFNTGTFQTAVGLVGNRLFTAAQNGGTIVERNPITGLVLNSYLSPGGAVSALAGSEIPEPAGAGMSLAAIAGLAIARHRSMIG